MTPAHTLSQAEQFERDAKFEDAVLAYAGILARNPKNARALQALDSLRGRLREQREPSADTKAELEAALAAGRPFEAADSCGALLKTFRESHFLWDFLGRCHLAAGHLDNAATCLNKACGIDAKEAGTYAAMGQVHMARGQLENAVALYRKALALDADCLLALRSLAEALALQGRSTEAAAALHRAVALAPGDAALHLTLAGLLQKLGAVEEAEDHYTRAVGLQPELAEAQFQLGLLLKAGGRPADALPCFDKILRASPSDDRARTQRLHVLAELCDWRWVQEYEEYRRLLGLRSSGCDPSALMVMEDNPDLLRVRAQAYASEVFPEVEPQTAPPAPQRPERLKAGYFFSARDAEDVLSHQAAIFAAHDRGRFEVFAYATGPGLAEETAETLRSSVSCLRILDGTSGGAAAVKADGLDIAVDLSGYCGGNRSSLFSAKLAPLHIAWPGYPGTMGTAAFDYLLSDSTTCPPGSERYHNEHLLRLPDSCVAVTAAVAASGAERADCGLPDTGFVFCSFAPASQITPQEFGIWMRLLCSTPDSVLWLLDHGAHAVSNLRRAAAARGVDPDRLVFARPAERTEHLARLTLTGLCLDTFTVNASAAARDALAAGVPVLTLPGQQFAARTGASLLQAAGMPELIADSADDYEAKAAALAADPEACAALKRKLRERQQDAPLFSAARCARQIESAYDAAYEQFLRGVSPSHLTLSGTQTPQG
ncbi:tetratricopeptide repeat protein [Leisingera aquaemixtae]|uniref:O-linked N-acetylglucosamine transferase, SPINDLY family protein n=1 Tax=Leisingera aquaemixtae TaxID=1396826 RepID=UPI0021A546F0|nr:tetratricopeptide repeat protein [Leisingera aquaemixtae]UWQ37617.1 tetratricopeptide repeat protein [Leisingera aquaemixtae]